MQCILEVNVWYNFVGGKGVCTLECESIDIEEIRKRISKTSCIEVWITKIEIIKRSDLND